MNNEKFKNGEFEDIDWTTEQFEVWLYSLPDFFRCMFLRLREERSLSVSEARTRVETAMSENNNAK